MWYNKCQRLEHDSGQDGEFSYESRKDRKRTETQTTASVDSDLEVEVRERLLRSGEHIDCGRRAVSVMGVDEFVLSVPRPTTLRQHVH